MSKKSYHIAIAGNIGSGKTTLTQMLSSSMDWVADYEMTETNPYLNDFYENMRKWSFHLQICFLKNSFNQLVSIKENNLNVVQDRSIYEDVYIFASNLHEMGLMSKRDFENYFELFLILNKQINPPDLLIFLKADIPKLVQNIQERGREYEGNMSLDYLKNLNRRYDQWITEYHLGKTLIIDVNQIDFKRNTEQYEEILKNVILSLGV